jgi:hypothetical protein
MLTAYEADAAVVPWAQQRRRHLRGDLCFKVRFRILRDEEALQVIDRLQGYQAPASAGTPGDSYTQNFSEGGLGICGQLLDLPGRSIKEGDFLKIELRPPRTYTVLRCMGRVSWVEISQDAGIFRAGVSFVAVNAGDLERLQPA